MPGRAENGRLTVAPADVWDGQTITCPHLGSIGLGQFGTVRAATTPVTASSARVASSASERSWIGWATSTPTGLNPRAFDWASAADSNSDVETKTPGTPRPSRSTMSCTLHDVQLPQSAKASTTASHSSAIKTLRSLGAGLA